MASVLNHSGSIEKITFFMEECKRMRINVLGPDVNEGYGKFSVIPSGDIRFGMASIKGVGENVITALVTERDTNGKFTSVFDLAKRLESKTVNKKSIENLALAGAFDNFEGVNRAMFFKDDTDSSNSLTELMIKYCNQNKTGNDTSQASLFGEENEVEISEPQLPKVEPWDNLTRLAKEKEVVGFFISGHPLDPYKLIFEHHCNANCNQLKAGLEPFKGKEITFGGIVKNPENRTSKTGNAFGKLSIEDYHGVIDIMLFSKDYIEFNKFMVPNIFVYVKAKVQDRYNQPGSLELKIQKIELLENVKENIFSNIKLKIDIHQVSNELIQQLEQIFVSNSGKCALEFIIEDKKENMNVKLYSKKTKVTVNDDLLFQLNNLNNIEVVLS